MGNLDIAVMHKVPARRPRKGDSRSKFIDLGHNSVTNIGQHNMNLIQKKIYDNKDDLPT